MVKYLLLSCILLLAVSAANAEALLFVSDRCPPCQIMKQHAKELINEGLDIRIINVYSKEAKRYNIAYTPTLVLVSGQTEIKRHVGLLSKEEFRRFLDSNPLKTNDNFTGAILIYNSTLKVDETTSFFIRRARKNRYGFKEIDLSKQSKTSFRELVDKYDLRFCVTIIIMEDGKELGRYICTQHHI